MTFRLETAQLLALWLGRWRLCHKLFVAIYDLAGWLLAWRLRALPGVNSVLLRGSRVSGQLVPGLSDLDFEVILSQAGGAEHTVQTVRAIHGTVATMRRVFPWLESPFIRSAAEWEAAGQAPHECLTHSRWRTLTGPFVVSQGAPMETRREALAQFRLCLRELTKTIPLALFKTPPAGVVSSARCNPDRLQALRSLGRLLGVALPDPTPWGALQSQLERQNFLTRSARSLLALHLAYQYQAMEALPEALLDLDRKHPDDRFALCAPAGTPSGPGATWREDALHPDLKRAAAVAGFELLASSGGCRYSQGKIYLLPPSGSAPVELALALELFVEAWQEHHRRQPGPFHLSYAAPIVLPRQMLALVHLGLGSCFEGFALRQDAVLTEPVAFATEAFAREMVDGVFVLRKKVSLLPGRPDRFIRYLQDYFVGVYPGLALALRQGEVCTQPEQAARRFCQTDPDGEYAERLAGYLSEDLQARSRQALEQDPFGHLLLLENFHRQLVSEKLRPD